MDCLRYLSGYPGLTYQRLQGRTDMEAPGIAASYTESSRRRYLGGDVEQRLLNRGLIPNISETYSGTRRRGSAF